MAEIGSLDFEYLGADVDRAAASPTVLLRLRVTESSGQPVHAVALRTQVRVEPHRRRYDDEEAAALVDLFGSRSRWGQTLKPLQLAFVSHLVPSFTGSIETSLALPCSYDFDVAANKYLYSLVEGVAPLLLLFSGTWFSGTSGSLTVLPIPWDKEVTAGLPVETSLALPCSYDFDVAANKYLYSLVEGVAPLLLLFSGTWFSGTSGNLTVLPIPWDKEVSAGLPVDVWRAAMDQHFPGTAWLRLGRDTFDALYRYRAENAMVSWDEAVTRLLKEADG
ncbi:MAG TPA: DUF6084 family protein [Lapillicoccus sp.]